MKKILICSLLGACASVIGTAISLMVIFLLSGKKDIPVRCDAGTPGA